jgi:predicted MPP superfamily phosphohydrolase
MKISILHLSDIHLKTGKNVVISRVKKIFDAAKNELLGKDAVFILTSGDIAFSGKIEEYAIAKTMYNELAESIEGYCKNLPYFVFVPGNHDCYFDESKEKVRGIVLKNFSQNGFGDLNKETIDLCCEPIQNYYDFVKPKKDKWLSLTVLILHGTP